jgi:hypothetical protein
LRAAVAVALAITLAVVVPVDIDHLYLVSLPAAERLPNLLQHLTQEPHIR